MTVFALLTLALAVKRSSPRLSKPPAVSMSPTTGSKLKLFPISTCFAAGADVTFVPLDATRSVFSSSMAR
jgi:hypothetical protein